MIGNNPAVPPEVTTSFEIVTLAELTDYLKTYGLEIANFEWPQLVQGRIRPTIIVRKKTPGR